MKRTTVFAAYAALILCALAACAVPFGEPANVPFVAQDVATDHPEATPRADGLAADEAHTLASLAEVDDYPLYTMHYYADYEGELGLSPLVSEAADLSMGKRTGPGWGCSLFVTLAQDGDMLYGRNFDWQFSPALLLYTYPLDGYASVSMVDVSYLFDGDEVLHLTDLALVERAPLLEATGWPFDGMNEEGLVVGMAAVPDSPMPRDLEKSTISSLGAIREILDHAANVEQAVDILSSYNMDWSGGPALHYLVADRAGRAALIEYYEGEMVVLRNETPWHMTTNHLRARVNQGIPASCVRYETIEANLEASGGQLDEPAAMDLLAQVSQPNTQWSVLYGLSNGAVRVAMGGEYAEVHDFTLKVGE